jgi:rhodanese-related sulfurtransferase
MDERGHFSISARKFYSRLGMAVAPIVVDVRRSPGFDADDTMILGAVRRSPSDVDQWRHQLPEGCSVVVHCAHGQEVSQNAAAALRAAGADASYLEHGISGWTELGLPRRRKLSPQLGKWVTRERPKIDRIACPWLIRRFVDPEALFLFAPTERVFAVAEETGATAYDIPGAEPFSHDGELCSFGLPQGVRHRRPGARRLGADRARCRHRAARAHAAISGSARHLSRPLGDLRRRSYDARARDDRL